MGRRKRRSNRQRDKDRRAFFLLRKIERRRLFDEAFWDGEHAETISLGSYPFLQIVKGEVLFDKRGYLNPSLERFDRGDYVEAPTAVLSC